MTVNLEQNQWQTIVNMLIKQPYDVAAPILNALMPQLQTQGNGQQQRDSTSNVLPSQS